jgi:hypothetical protein
LHVTELITRRKQPLVSIEITPPEKGRSVCEPVRSVDQLVPFRPAFISVTCRQGRFVYEHAGVRCQGMRLRAGAVLEAEPARQGVLCKRCA